MSVAMFMQFFDELRLANGAAYAQYEAYFLMKIGNSSTEEIRGTRSSDYLRR